VVLLSAIHRVHPDSLKMIPAGFDRLAGGPALRESILAGQDPFAIAAAWKTELSVWTRHREPVLLYP
jgi:hypothetical protein